MKCHRCKLEAWISSSKYVVENDDTPDAETKLYTVMEFRCRNPKCNEYDKVVETQKVPLDVEKEV